MSSARRKDRASSLTLKILPVIGFLIAWETFVTAFPSYALTIPPPSQVGSTFGELIASGKLLRNTAVSVSRVIQGYTIGVATALPLGLLVGYFPRVEDLSDFLIEGFRPIPPIAWIPLAIALVGLGGEATIFIIFIGAFFPVLINTISGAKSVDPDLLEMTRTMGAKGDRDILTKVVLPSAVPFILTGMRIGIGLAWMSVVAAEMIATDSGLGFMIITAERFFRMDEVIAGMVTIGVIGLLFDRLARYAEGKLLVWKPEVKR